ncbi:MAG: HipA domain-containing protein [Bacteroidales bacterium]|nr:HipA domain-containing protein [Bacteroidales bacterium]
MTKIKHITELPILKHSGYNPKPNSILTAKKHQYHIEKGYTITGDAPKDFIRLYHYGEAIKAKPKTWSLYIAKLGHKHYPVESITEYLLNRIGEVMGFKISHSELAWLGGQIRFLSKYFIKKTEEQTLEHGADLYAGYLHDRKFVEEVEQNKLSPSFFTVQFTKETLKSFFPNDAENLFNDFISLLVFDAFIGNNDRHFYNWGIIRNLLGKERPVFSKIFDTARGLFWNYQEQKIIEIFNDKNRLESTIKKYSENCSPKTGWDDKSSINHFDLLENMKSVPVNLTKEQVQKFINKNTFNAVIELIEKEFSLLLSNERRTLIKKCLMYRYNRIVKIF